MIQFPTFITVPTPMHELRARGPYAKNPFGATIPVRLSRIDADMLMAVAQQMEMPRGSLMRWASVHTARVLQEHITRVEAEHVRDEAQATLDLINHRG